MDGGKSWFKEPLKKGLKAVKQRLKNRKNKELSVKKTKQSHRTKTGKHKQKYKERKTNRSVKI